MLNRKWHQAHVMPKNASLAERVRWHAGHARACGCREMPEGIVEELRRLGRPVPRPRRSSTSRSKAGA